MRRGAVGRTIANAGLRPRAECFEGFCRHYTGAGLVA